MDASVLTSLVQHAGKLLTMVVKGTSLDTKTNIKVVSVQSSSQEGLYVSQGRCKNYINASQQDY
jgi:hypothetical protein